MDNTADNTLALLRATLVTRFKANCALDQVSLALGIGIETLRDILDDYLAKWSGAEQIGAVAALGDKELQRLMARLEAAEQSRSQDMRASMEDDDLDNDLLSEIEDAMDGRR